MHPASIFARISRRGRAGLALAGLGLIQAPARAQTPVPLAAPTAVAASDGAYVRKIAVTWDPVPRATAYRIFRAATPEATAAIAIGVTSSWIFWDTSAAPTQVFHYWVRAENDGLTSPLSGSDSGFRATASTTGVGLAPLEPPTEPAGNLTTAAKVALGKALFWDEQLSSTNTVACGTCHFPERGGADARSLPGLTRARHPGSDGIPGTADDITGSPGVPTVAADGTYAWDATRGFAEQVTSRTSRPMTNAAFFPEAFWDGRAGGVFRDPLTEAVVLAAGGALESQALGPLLNSTEMAQAGRTWPDVTGKVAASWPLALATGLPPGLARWIGTRTYPELFEDAFGSPEITPVRIAFALAAYQRTLFTDRSPFDEAAAQIRDLPAAAARGLATFNSHTCVECHAGTLFSDGAPHHIGVRPSTEAFDSGRFAVTNVASDRGKFVTPSLRNAALRPVFMHTGGLTSLDAVFRFYDRGGDFGGGANELRGINLNGNERSDLTAFIESLTDPRLAARQFPFDRPVLFSESDRGPRLAGAGRPGSGGHTPHAIAFEPPHLGNARFTLALQGGLGGAPAVLVIDAQEPPLDRIPAAAEVAARFTLTLEGTGAGNGRASVRWPVPREQALAGTRYFARWYVTDAGAPGGFAASERIEFTLFGEHGTSEVGVAARLSGFSARVTVGGASPPAAGIVVGGTGRKRVVLRAVGPTLARFGIVNPLTAPLLDLAAGATPLGTIAGWRAEDADTMAGVGAFPFATASADAAVVTTLSPGNTTATLRGSGSTSGIALLEIYDADGANATTWLAGLSTRAPVGTGAGVLIGGFTVLGETPVTLLVRAIGPGLAQFGVTDALADPQLTLHRATGIHSANDDWSTSPAATAIEEAATRVGAFRLVSGSKDAGLLVTLSAGNYSAVVAGFAGATGTALLEIYVVP